jgi:hypothetical protein
MIEHTDDDDPILGHGFNDDTKIFLHYVIYRRDLPRYSPGHPPMPFASFRQIMLRARGDPAGWK